MDKDKLQKAAESLQALLSNYAPTHEAAAALERALLPLMELATSGKVTTPVDTKHVPGRRTFDETDARELPGLEEAYATFKLEISGGEPPALQIFQRRHGLDGEGRG